MSDGKHVTVNLWPSGDLGLFVGLALLILALGYVGCIPHRADKAVERPATGEGR